MASCNFIQFLMALPEAEPSCSKPRINNRIISTFTLAQASNIFKAVIKSVIKFYLETER